MQACRSFGEWQFRPFRPAQQLPSTSSRYQVHGFEIVTVGIAKLAGCAEDLASINQRVASCANQEEMVLLRSWMLFFVLCHLHMVHLKTHMRR
jgi:hypothetical protein